MSLMLGEDERAVNPNVEDAVLAPNQLGFHAKPFLQ